MPIASYECLFLLDPTKTGSDPEALKTQLNGILEKHGAEVLVSRKWDDNRKLAYPIKGHKKGVYHLAFFKMESRKMADIELDIRLNELILRHLVSHIDPKWEDDMLAVAKDEHRSALQIMHEESSEGGGGAIGGVDDGLGLDEGGEGRRRPRRSPDAEVGKE